MACRTFQSRVAGGYVGRAAIALLLGLICFAGCNEPEQIREYSVKKDPLPEPTHRMLAVLVPEGGSLVADSATQDAASKPPNKDPEPSAPSNSDSSQPATPAWIFKLVGPLDEVEAVAKNFDQFVASVRTGTEGLPEWQLPEGWTEDPAGRDPRVGREAMIQIGQARSRLDLAVSKLPMPGERRESWLLRNVNRWRTQMDLPAIAHSELGESTEEIKVGDASAIKVDLSGVFGGGPMVGKLARTSANTNAATAPQPAHATTGASEEAVGTALPFDAEVPEGWTPGRTSGGFRVAAYNIQDDDGKVAAEVTVTPLGPAAGDLKANVDRWRQEIKLPPARPEELDSATKSLEIDGRKADYVHLVGPDDAKPREATLGVILRRPDRVWFFKLRGRPDIVEREKPRFEEYVKSVKFN